MDATEAITTQSSTIEEWTSALEEATGSPGGGAGAGVMLGIAASLISMVAGYTTVDEAERAELGRIRSKAQALRKTALQLADHDAAASRAFGAAFRQEPGPDRDAAIAQASVDAAKASAVLGLHAQQAIEPLAWLAVNGNPALIADVVVAFGALRATVAGARTNVSYDLAALASGGSTLDQVREQHPVLWKTVGDFNTALERIDVLTSEIDHRAAPTDGVEWNSQHRASSHGQARVTDKMDS